MAQILDFKISDDQLKLLGKRAEKERERLLRANPELEELQKRVDRDNSVLSSPKDRVKVLFQRMRIGWERFNKSMEMPKATNSHADKMFEAMAGSKVETETNDLNENIKKGFENLFKDGNIPKSGSIELFSRGDKDE